MNIPSVRISDASLLAKLTPNAFIDTEDQPISKAELASIVDTYREAWNNREHIILNGLQTMLGVAFLQPLIDVSISPWKSKMGISSPLIIGCGAESDEFIDILTHELIHVLLTDNDKYSKRNGAIVPKLRLAELFGAEHSPITATHIAVHACAKAIYLDVLAEPYRLERDIKHCSDYQDYKLAWDYVEANDYKEIIEKLKQDYKRIQDES